MVDLDRQALTVKGRATRDRIIACATELALSRGYDKLTFDSVRRAAAVSGSQMTHYFNGREALVRAIISRQTQALVDFHQQPALRGLDTFEDFDRWADLTLRFARRRTAVRPVPTYGAVACELSRADAATRELLTDGYRQWSEVLVAGLQRMKDRGDLVAGADPAQMAWLLMRVHQGGDALSIAFQRPWPDRQALAFALSYLRSFAADPARRTNWQLPQPKRDTRR
jgi:AcrR family transcriptional regulator